MSKNPREIVPIQTLNPYAPLRPPPPPPKKKKKYIKKIMRTNFGPLYSSTGLSEYEYYKLGAPYDEVSRKLLPGFGV